MEEQPENIQIVTTHAKTDFDAFASVICATLLYPGVIPVLPRNINSNVKAFHSIHKNLFEIYHPDQIDFYKVNRLILADVNSWSRLEHIKPLRSRQDMDIIVWDHHFQPLNEEDCIKASIQHTSEVGATITLMVNMLQKQQLPIDPIYATLFLTGIYEDTGNMLFPSTTSADVRAAAYLLDQKADLKIVANFLRPAYTERQKLLLFNMLQSAERTKINGFSVSFNKQNIEGHFESLAVVVQMYMQVLNVDAAFGIFTNKDKCIIIGRSATNGVDMGLVMREIGGGGNAGAGSATLKNIDADTAENMIRNILDGKGYSIKLVRDIMTSNVISVPPTASMEEVANILREKGCTGVPVLDDTKIVGIISRRDFQKLRRRTNAMKSPVKAFMKRNVLTISGDKNPLEAARLMVKYDIGRLPVVENDTIIGIITRSDAMKHFYKSA